MKRLQLGFVIVVTALVSAVLTSAVWLFATSRGPLAEEPAQVVTQTTEPDARPELVLAPSGLAIPVAGVTADQLIDTYSQARGGGVRIHDAIDIMAPHGTPVIAAAPGTVEKLFYSRGGGGLTVYIRSDDRRWIYYYAHLQSYAPGLAEGQRVERGDPIGTVGSSGNASPSGPHLHFAVHRVAPDDDWHGGTPVNPFPLLGGPRVDEAEPAPRR
ncbi:MAG: M23 family metallopeptidase [Pseudomonadota bacterium]|nr:M23 family metallopeptidase [Pseudomonadota bacterium]